MQESEYLGKFLTTEDILKMHSDIISKSEVEDSEGFIDVTGGRFESSVESIFGGFGGVEMYPTVLEKAVRLCFNIINNHCFLNANKRTGLMALLATLDMNGIRIKYDENEMFDVICKVGSGEIEYEEFLEYIKSCVIEMSLVSQKATIK